MNTNEEFRIIDIRDVNTHQTRTDGRYSLRIGRIVKRPGVHLGLPAILGYIRNADGSDYSGKYLRTSIVCDYFINEKGNMIIVTLNSIYELEPIKAESDGD